jgi:predicted DNA binding protein
MGIITEITVPGTAFELGETLAAVGDVHVTFERVVPSGDRLFPYMWVTTEDHDELCACLRENGAIADVELLHQDEGRGLYDISWAEDTDGLLNCLKRSDPIVLRAGGSADAWEFELRFNDQDGITAFQEECASQNISVTVDRVLTKSVAESPMEKLSETQRQTVQLALEKGYFDVPRKTTLGELAEELGISDQAVSARLRRSMKKLSAKLLLPYQDQEQYQD